MFPPPKPARPHDVKIVNPKELIRQKKRDNDDLANMLIHSLVHIESMAIDLSWDIISRFHYEQMPKQFYSDMVSMAEDEARVLFLNLIIIIL